MKHLFPAVWAVTMNIFIVVATITTMLCVLNATMVSTCSQIWLKILESGLSTHHVYKIVQLLIIDIKTVNTDGVKIADPIVHPATIILDVNHACPQMLALS